MNQTIDLWSYNRKYFNDIIRVFYSLLNLDFKNDDKIMKVYSKEFYAMIKGFTKRYDVLVETKYKTMAKKFKLVALQLPTNSEKKIERASNQLNLKDKKKKNRA